MRAVDRNGIEVGAGIEPSTVVKSKNRRDDRQKGGNYHGAPKVLIGLVRGTHGEAFVTSWTRRCARTCCYSMFRNHSWNSPGVSKQHPFQGYMLDPVAIVINMPIVSLDDQFLSCRLLDAIPSAPP